MAEPDKKDIDRAVEYGRLLASVDNLTIAVTNLTTDVIALKAQLNTGRGMAMGLLAAASVAGGTAGAFIHKLMEAVK